LKSQNIFEIKLDVRTENETIIFYISSPFCKLIIVQDGDVIYILDSEMNSLNELNVEDFEKLSLSDFAYNRCLYSLYKRFLNLLVKD
jgi:hypothetical protein